MQKLVMSAFDKTPVKELLTDFQDNQNFKEQRDENKQLLSQNLHQN